MSLQPVRTIAVTRTIVEYYEVPGPAEALPAAMALAERAQLVCTRRIKLDPESRVVSYRVEDIGG